MIKLKALTSFTSQEGKIREGDVFEATESRTKELVRLNLAEETTEVAKPRKKKPGEGRETKPAAGAADMTTKTAGIKPEEKTETKDAEGAK